MNTRLLPVLLCAAAAAAQQPAEKNDKPAPKAPPAAKEPAKPAKPAWPEHKQKKLYGKDLRGQKAPEFVVEKMLSGKPDREGKVVLIDFWATWCPPCRATIPELNDLQAKFKDDLVVIGISDEPAAKVEEFAKKTPMKYASAIDTQKRMNKAAGVQGIPHVLIISTDGIVRWQGFPLSDEEHLTPEIVKQIIDADPGVKARHEKAKAPARK